MKTIQTGFRSLDRALGLRRGQLVLLTGSTACGKSTLALSIASRIAFAKRPQAALYFSNDSCRHLLLERLVAAKAKCPLHEVRDAAFKQCPSIVGSARNRHYCCPTKRQAPKDCDALQSQPGHIHRCAERL